MNDLDKLSKAVELDTARRIWKMDAMLSTLRIMEISTKRMIELHPEAQDDPGLLAKLEEVKLAVRDALDYMAAREDR